MLDWPADTELVGLIFELNPRAADYLYAQYTIGLHAWFLDQVRQTDPELSAYLHDGESEKPFTISGLEGSLLTSGKEFQLHEDETYRWYVTALSSRVVAWMIEWRKHLPAEVELRNAPLEIRSCEIALPPTTYQALYEADFPSPASISLSFTSPTSFRRKGYHLPLPWPVNVFHSYSRRWNDFSQMPVDQEAFLEWVDEKVLITRHKLESAKVAAGKKGMVTGFTGSVEYRLVREATAHSEFERLFYTLGKFAPY
ncbi:CRISPR-associated endoribonuclease Cas6 [Microcoleus sp. FACHB-68]|nr:CRISPR-associated endoribonuclease Cas6 [Microcoleus sp. FACHB-68]